MSGTPQEDGVVEEIPVFECWSLLRAEPFGRFAVYTPADGVEVFPVNHVVDQGSIVFRTAEGRKCTAVEEMGTAAFEIDGVDADDRAWSVVVKGSARVLSRRDELFAIFDLQVDPWSAGRKPCFVRLSPDTVSGRRFPIVRRA